MSADVWAFDNITIDSLMMVFHFIFWIFLLILIEKGVFSFLRIRYDAPLSKEA